MIFISHTLLKPKGTEEESRKSSTCQPGNVSIKYSDMLLVETIPSCVDKFPPTLLTVACVDAVEGEGLSIEVGCEMTEEVEKEFLGELCNLETDIESEPFVKTGLEVDGE